jgi:phenylpropionate dioxygenase-like ring-hydroxylating dioxygenase large terminal subunit
VEHDISIYLKNVWYAAAFSDEVNDSPFARTLLDTELAIFRQSNGAAVILRDRCPHRFAPLSLGKVIGDELQCPYHGLRFGSSGACTHNPHAKEGGPLKAASVRSYPVLEKYGIVWFWPGAVERAYQSLLPEIAFLTEPERFGVVKGYLHVKGNYQLVVDNLLDLSHAQYIHPEFAVKGVDAEKALAHTTVKLERRERSVFNYRMRSGLPAPTATKALFGVGDDTLVHVKTHMTWHPPAMLDFDAGSWEIDTPEAEGALIPQLHFITPETEFTSHYFFINGRNRRLGDPDVDAALLNLFDTAFRRQDEPMIAAVQKRMGNVSDIEKLRPVLLQIDSAPAAARRMLAMLIAEENASSRQEIAAG